MEILADNFFDVYINGVIQNFRRYNKDVYTIKILGLKRFIDAEDKILDSLITRLSDNGIRVDIEGDNDSIRYLDIKYKNETNEDSGSFQFYLHNMPSVFDLSSKIGVSPNTLLVINIVSNFICLHKVLYKCIVLDLDETLWCGTLSEDGLAKIIDNMKSPKGLPYIYFMRFIKNLAKELGIYVSICSRNKVEDVEHAIKEIPESIFPLKGEIDYIIANDNDKSDGIKSIAKHLSILPTSILFIDDNQIVRDEVKQQIPEVLVLDWASHEELVTMMVATYCFDRCDLSLNDRNRRKSIKILQEEKKNNRLPKLFIKVNEDIKHLQANKLYSKSNQFKLTENRFADTASEKSFYFNIYRNNGNDIGICAAMTYIITNEEIHVVNWAISCRFFEIGLEEFLLLFMKEIGGDRQVYIDFSFNGRNLKAQSLFEKYSAFLILKDSKSVYQFNTCKLSLGILEDNTNLEFYE